MSTLPFTRPIDRGWVTFQQIWPAGLRPLTVRLGPGGIFPNGGYGVWEEVARPKRRSFTHWVGNGLVRMPLPIVFDRYVVDQSVEESINLLKQIAQPLVPTMDQAPVLRVSGPGIPYTYLEWVIDDIEWGDYELVSNSSARSRQHAVVHLLQYLEADVVIERSPAEQAAAIHQLVTRPTIDGPSSTPDETGSAQKTYVVKQGDTLWGIASKLLNDGNRWPEIADLNGIRDERALQIGQVLRIP